jgi:hypothetical protein
MNLKGLPPSAASMQTIVNVDQQDLVISRLEAFAQQSH